MYNIKSNKQDETKNIINDYSISNLITLMNLFVFIKRGRSTNEILQ